jgi:hypothetical protein
VHLGSGESGKSTIVKQMKIIHQNGFCDKERADYRHIIYKNLMESAQSIVLAMRKLGLVPEEPINRVRHPSPSVALPPSLTVSFTNLGQCRQNYGLRLGPHLICVNILLPGRPRPRSPSAMGGSHHPKTSRQTLERVLPDGQCSLVCLFCPALERQHSY